MISLGQVCFGVHASSALPRLRKFSLLNWLDSINLIMQVFELYFNPKKNEKDTIFNSFCYEPENVYERRLGALYIAGEIKNVLPQNFRLLDKISRVIKERYYGYDYGPNLKSPEAAIKEGLKALNDFFSEELKKENISWMGNLNLAIVSLIPNQGTGADLNFTKIGEIKIVLLRDGQVSNIGSKLDQQEIEPYPLKVFSNIVSGKIAQGDIIAVLTEDVFEFFHERNLTQKIALEKQLKEKEIKEILKPEERDLVKISGICLLIQVQSEIQPKSILAFQEKFEKFSIFQVFLPFSNLLKKIHQVLLSVFAKMKIGTRPLGSRPSIASEGEESKFFPKPRFRIPAIPKFAFFKVALSRLRLPVLNKNLILISLLIFVLLGGFFLSQREKAKELKILENKLNEVKEEIARGENLLLLKDEEKANIFFQEAFNDVLPLIKENSPFREEALVLKKSIEENLNKLNKTEEIEMAEIIFEFKPQEAKLIPEQMLLSDSTLYFYNPLSSNIYKLDRQGVGEVLNGKINLQYGAQYLDSILFFSKPNSLISLIDNKFQEKNFEMPDFNALASFRSNIYFLDSKSGEIIKQSPSLSKKVAWLKPETKKAISAKSIAVDGSVWVLTKNNQIDRYQQGLFRETIKINLFPELKSPTKIWTRRSLPHLYLLEPEQKRLIVLDKKGKIVKQYQSEKFDKLLDFAVSSDGKIIYLLNGLKVYQINF